MRRLLAVVLPVMFLFSFVSDGVCAVDTEEEIRGLKTQVEGLLKRIEQLEQEQAEQKEEALKQREESSKAQTPAVPKVDLSNTLAKLKIKGRWAAGYFDSGEAGSFRSGSFEMPEGKIQFAFQPDDINTIIMRFNLNNATAQSPLMDYFYLQSKDFLPFLENTPFTLSSRLGRFKLGFGEETITNNPVEGVLPSNSAGNVGLNDEGLELSGKLKLEKIGLKPLGWAASVSNGNSGAVSDNGSEKAFMGKLYYTPLEPLYLSASYYNSGSLKTSNAEMSIAGLAAPPAGAINWERKFWELDARYDFGKGSKPLEPIAFSDSKAILRLSYGVFTDTVTSAAAERTGNFGFAEGTYNLTKKFYTAARFSFVNLDGDITAALNGITANRYDRYSLGAGYRLSENTILKLSYDWNKESGIGTQDANNNLLSAIIGAQF